MIWLTEGLIVLSMLAVNAVFAAYEMALASVSRARLEALAQLNRRGARSAVLMKGRLERSLAVVQVGITLAGAIAAATGGAGVDQAVAPALSAHFGLSDSSAEFVALLLFVVPLSALTIVFAELVPKMFAIRNKEVVALALSPAMRALTYIIYPAIFVLEAVVKRIMRLAGGRAIVPDGMGEEKVGLAELRAAASLARASRLIGPLEERIVHSAARLAVRTLGEVMLPANEIATIPENTSLMDALNLAHLHMHTRYPTCAATGSPKAITGYVNFKDIVAALRITETDPSLKGIVRPIEAMRQDTPLSRALERMIRDSVHIAVVTDAAGATLGLITLEDIVEELVGDITDEYDRLPAHIHPLAQGWVVGGGASMEAVRKATGTSPPPAAAGHRTLAAWCEAHNPGPADGEGVIRADGLEVRTRKVRRGKVMEAIVRPCQSKSANHADGRP